MKNTWYEKFRMLMKLNHYTKWLLQSDKPLKEKLAIWQKDFDRLMKELDRYDFF